MRRDVFQAIADPRRRAIIQILTISKLTINALADHFEISRPAISKHVKILEECGLIIIDQHGRERYCEAKLEKLSAVSNWADKYRLIWEKRFDRLDEYLSQLQETDNKELSLK